MPDGSAAALAGRGASVTRLWLPVPGVELFAATLSGNSSSTAIRIVAGASIALATKRRVDRKFTIGEANAGRAPVLDTDYLDSELVSTAPPAASTIAQCFQEG